jgi:hypothetical protein
MPVRALPVVGPLIFAICAAPLDAGPAPIALCKSEPVPTGVSPPIIAHALVVLTKYTAMSCAECLVLCAHIRDRADGTFSVEVKRKDDASLAIAKTVATVFVVVRKVDGKVDHPGVMFLTEPKARLGGGT